MNQKRSVGVGLVGAGNFARSQHLPNVVQMDAGRLVAVCDTDPDILKAVGDEYRPVALYDDFDAMLARDDIEVVIVTVRDTLQPTMAMRALGADKHVYVEKPLSAAVDECRAVARAVEESGRRLAVGYNKRFAPMYAKAKDIVEAHGGASNIHLAMTDDAWRWATGYPPGYLMTLDVCHHVDLVQWLTGSPVRSVYCRSSRSEDDALLLTTASGCVATLMFSGNDAMDAPKEYARIIADRGSVTGEDFVELFVHGFPDHPPSYRFLGHLQGPSPVLHRRLMEKQGIAGWRDIRRIAWEVRHGHGAAPTVHERPFIPNFIRDQGWYGALESFLTAVAEDSPSGHATAADALRVCRVIAAAVRSRESGGAIAVEE